MLSLTKRQQERLRKAIRAYGEANFECGEWNRNDADEPWDSVYGRAENARKRIEKLLAGPLDPTSSGA